MATLTQSQKNSLNAASASLGNVASQLKAKQSSGQTTVKLTDTVNLGGGSGSNGKSYTSSNNAITQATEALAPTVAEVQKTGQYFTLPQGLTGAPTAITPTFGMNDVGAQNPQIRAYTDMTGNISDAYASSLTASDVTPEQQMYDRVAQQKLDRADKLAGFDFSREQSRAEQAGGIPQMQAQLNDLNVQIAQKQGEYNKLFNTAENKAIPTPFIIGEQNEIKKTAAIEIGMLTATQQALQGNIQAAQATADRAVDLKYKTIIGQIQAYDTQLETIKVSLDKQEKKQAEKIQLQLKAQSDANALKLDLSKTANDLISEAYKNKAPYSAYSKAYQQVKDGDPTGAMQTISPWIKEKLASDSIPLTITDKQYLISAGLTRDEIVNIEYDINLHGLDKVSEGISDPKQLTAIRSVYGGKESNQFLTKEYLSSIFTDDQLKVSAEEAGFREVFSSWETEKENYLKSLESDINSYRTAGYSDKEIYNLLK